MFVERFQCHQRHQYNSNNGVQHVENGSLMKWETENAGIFGLENAKSEFSIQEP